MEDTTLQKNKPKPTPSNEPPSPHPDSSTVADTNQNYRYRSHLQRPPTTQHNKPQHNTTQHNTTQRNTTQHTTPHHTTPHHTTRHDTTRHDTTPQHTTPHHTTAQRHNDTPLNPLRQPPGPDHSKSGPPSPLPAVIRSTLATAGLDLKTPRYTCCTPAGARPAPCQPG
jgi:hypothetical protein